MPAAPPNKHGGKACWTGRPGWRSAASRSAADLDLLAVRQQQANSSIALEALLGNTAWAIRASPPSAQASIAMNRSSLLPLLCLLAGCRAAKAPPADEEAAVVKGPGRRDHGHAAAADLPRHRRSLGQRGGRSAARARDQSRHGGQVMALAGGGGADRAARPAAADDRARSGRAQRLSAGAECAGPGHAAS